MDQTKKNDPALADRVVVLDDMLGPRMCGVLGAFIGQSGTRRIARGDVRHAPESAWTERAVPEAIMPTVRETVIAGAAEYQRRANVSLPLAEAQLEWPRVKQYHVAAGDHFSTHFDVRTPESLGRFLVCLFYLNDVAEGGATVFPELDLTVAPKAGRLVMFPPYWPWRHAGRAPISNDKLIVSTYLRFDDGRRAP